MATVGGSRGERRGGGRRRWLVAVSLAFACAIVAALAARVLLELHVDAPGVASGLSTTERLPQSRGVSANGTTKSIGLLQLGGTLSNASNQRRYSLVIVSRDDVSAATALPGRSLVYTAAPDIPPEYSDGVPLNQAKANGWLLKDSSGDYLTNRAFDYYLGDIGNSGYQQAWLRNVLAYLTSHRRLRGVFIDDVIADSSSMAGGYPAQYPSQQAWADAMASFVAKVGPALEAKGYYVLVNAVGYIVDDPGSSDGTADIAWWRRIGPYVDGLMNENYQQISDGSGQLRASGPAWYQHWDGWQRLIGVAQGMGKDFVGLTDRSTDDTEAMVYGKASFLLDWNGGGGVFIFSPPDDESDPWNAAWTGDIGLPAAAKQQVGVGWLRRYTNGVALVNPSPASSQTFDLGGPYVTQSGTPVTSVTLQPTTGMILVAAAARDGGKKGGAHRSHAAGTGGAAPARPRRARRRAKVPRRAVKDSGAHDDTSS